jgi:sulfur-carrier protein
MAVKVLVPGLLASQAGGRKEFEVEGATLGAALRELPLRDLLFDESGALRPLVNVYVDRQDMRMRDGLDTPLDGDEEIQIVAAIAGGCA